MPRAARIVAACFLLFASLPAHGQVMVDGTVASDYIFRGVNMYNGVTPVFISHVNWTMGESGLAVNSWGYFAMTNRVNSWVVDGDEIDVTVDYTRGFGNWMSRVGIFHLSLPRLEGWPSEGTTVNEAYVEVGRPDWPGMPVVSVSYELKDFEDHDTYLQLRGGHEMVLEGGTLLYLGASVGFWSYGSGSVPNFTDEEYYWNRREEISDINLEVATTVILEDYALTPRIVMTLSPDEVINPDQMIVWGSLTLARAFPGMKQ